MKLRATPRAQRVVVEMEPQESGLPAIALPEIGLKKNLVPVDFSEQSRKALHYAVSFAKQFNSEIILLHVVEIVPTPELIIGESAHLNTQLREEGALKLADWRKETAAVRARTSLQNGNPFREIIRAANEMNADFIILGTQGLTGLSRFFIGSTAERVVRHAPCPVMVVREREHDFIEEETRVVSRSKKQRRQPGKRREK